jgi:hypothetical protein
MVPEMYQAADPLTMQSGPIMGRRFPAAEPEIHPE